MNPAEIQKTQIDPAAAVEQVLVVPTRRLFGAGAGFQGFQSPGRTDFLQRAVRFGEFRPRPEMEEDPSFKQIIPYILIERKGALFLMRRTRAQSEARLHDLYSIGVGGHVNPGDGDGEEDAVMGGALREFREEVRCDAPFAPKFIGCINDDSTPVGSVHFGVVYLQELDADDEVEVAEKDKMQGRFVPWHEAEALAGSMESWSRLSLREAGRLIQRRETAS